MARETSAEYGWSLKDILQKPDVNIFVSYQIQASTATQLSFGPAVDQKISEDYSKIFSMHEKHESKNASKFGGNSIKMCEDFSLLLQSQNNDPIKGILISRFKQYWEFSIREEENSADQQSAESLIAEIIDSLEKLHSKISETLKLAKVSPIEDISWAIYTMFFENPYRHLKRTLNACTDLLIMIHAMSLVHCYQLAFSVTAPEVKDSIDALKLLFEDNKSNKTQPDREGKNKESQINSKGETQQKPMIFSTLSDTIIDRVRFSLQEKPPDRENMIILFKEFVDMEKNLDTFDKLESKTSFSKKEENAIDYVYRCHLTMGISSSITDGIQQLAKIQYEFSHQQTAETLKHELLGCITSLLLGYEYLYHPNHCPSSRWYLLPEVVIRFLLANESAFENMLEPDEYKQKSLLDPRILESPLVKCVINLSKLHDISSKNLTDGNNIMTASYHIKWFNLAKSDELDACIIEFLANDRFNWQLDEESLIEREKDLRNAINKHNKWHHYLKVYKNVANDVFLAINEINGSTDKKNENKDSSV
ncbi:43657_t:CDS:2, partial [Gigaspora margarita]